MIIQGLVLTGIEVMCCNLFFRTFMKKRFEKRYCAVGAILILFCLSFLGIAMVMQQHYLLKAISTILAIAIFMLILYKTRVSQIIFYSICYYGILLTVDSGMIWIVQYLSEHKMDYLLQDSFKITVLGILCKSVLFLVMVIVNRKFSIEDDYSLLEDREWIRFLFFPIFTITAILLLFFMDGKEEGTVLIISFGLLTSNFILFYLIRDFVRRAKENRELSLSHEHTKGQMEMYESMKLSYKEQRIKAHEFKNHIDCIQGLLQENEIAKAIEYVGSMNKGIESHMNYFNTSNPVINAVINQKYRQAKAKGIAVIMALDRLEDVRMQEEDLVVLLANLLDNAIEACEKLEEDRRFIRFKFIQNEEKIIISIKNPVLKEVHIIDGQISSTKDNKQEHGIGMLNLKNIIEKYRGEGIYTCHDGYFFYTIIFHKRNIIKGRG